uniref:Uncharacterized protein n=1 Tax=Romanomermis culicivorax TaxID=13658 RepID=A0A915K321_ROMCU
MVTPTPTLASGGTAPAPPRKPFNTDPDHGPMAKNLPSADADASTRNVNETRAVLIEILIVSAHANDRKTQSSKVISEESSNGSYSNNQ